LPDTLKTILVACLFPESRPAATGTPLNRVPTEGA
jgi:hypothetical protein